MKNRQSKTILETGFGYINFGIGFRIDNRRITPGIDNMVGIDEWKLMNFIEINVQLKDWEKLKNTRIPTYIVVEKPTGSDYEYRFLRFYIGDGKKL